MSNTDCFYESRLNVGFVYAYRIELLWLKIIAVSMMQAKKANFGFRSDPRLLPRIRDVSFKIF